MADRVFSYEFRGQFNNLTAGLTTASRNVQELSGKLTALDRDGAKMRAGLTQIGGTAGRVGLVAAAGLGAVIGAAAKFDQAMSAVSAVTGESAENMDKLREAAIQAGADTAFSATEAAAGIENLAKAGVSTADILGGGLSGALDLAAAGGIEVSEAAEAASKAMTQFGLAGADVPHIADLLAAAAGKATGDVSDFTQALNQSGLVANQVGLSIEETTGGLAAFASAGLLGSDAGTSFKTMLAALTPNSTKAAEQMEALGLNAYDAQGNFVGLADFAGQLQTALGDMSAEQRQAALETIFGSDAVRAASVLYEQGESGIRDWTAAVDDSGYAAEVAGERLDNLAGDWEAFKGSLETALIGAGEGSQGPLRKLLQGATSAVNAFNDLPPAVQGTTSALLGITAITGGAAWFGAKVINGIADTKQALDDLGISAGRANSNLGAVAKAGAGLAIVAQVGAGIGAAIANLTGANLELEDLDRNLQSIANGVANDALGNIVDDLRIVGDSEGWVGGLKEGTVEVLSLNGAFGTFGTTLDGAQSDLEAVDQKLARLVESGNADQAAKIFEAIVAELNGLPAGSSMSQAALDAVMGKFDSYRTAAENAATATGEVTEEGTGAAGALDEVGGAAEEAASSVKTLLDSLDMLLSPRLDLAAASDAWAAGLRNLDDSLAEGTSSLKGNTDAADKNRAAVRDQVSNLLNLVNAQAETGAGAKQLEGQMRRGYDAIIAAGKAAGISEDQMRDYLATLGLTPKQISTIVKAMTADANANLDETQGKANRLNGTVARPKVEAQTAAAISAIQSVWDRLNILDGKTATTYVTTRKIGQSPGFGPTGSADGGTVPKTGLAYADRHLYMLADGEEVISNRRGQADRYRPLLKAINNAADGATVGNGIGPNNPLYGIGRDFLSSSELAVRLANLTLGQLARVGEDMDGLSKGSLKKLAAALEKAGNIAEREMAQQIRHLEKRAENEREEQELHRERLDAMRDELEALQESKDSFAKQVASNFTSGIFGGEVSLSDAYARGDLGATFNAGLEAFMNKLADAATGGGGAWSAMDLVDDYVKTLSAQDRRTVMGNAAVSQLEQDTKSAGSFQYLLGELEKLNFDGAGYEQLAASGNADFARYLISLGESGIADFEATFNERQAQLDSLGLQAGDAVFGSQIDQQLEAVKEQTAILAEQRDLTRKAEERAERAERRTEQYQRINEKLLERVEKAAAVTGPERVANAVNRAASSAGK